MATRHMTRGFATKQDDPSHAVTWQSESVRPPADTASPTDDSEVPLAHKTRLRKISTLDPTKLTQPDYFGLLPTGSGRRVFFGDQLNPPKRHEKPSFVSPIGLPDFRFPETSGGFLYYYKHPAPVPALAGEIRFRVTEGSHPESFASGHDLLASDTLPWRNNFLSLVGRTRGQRIAGILLRDGLVSAEDIALAARLRMPQANRCVTVHSFGQPFYIPFSRTHRLTILGHQNIRLYSIRATFGLYVRTDKGDPYVFPWLGSGLCCFERSERNGKRAVVLRVLKIVDPVRPNPEFPDDTLRNLRPMPVEGELYPLRSSRYRKPQLELSLESARARPHPLATLYDNEAAAV